MKISNIGCWFGFLFQKKMSTIIRNLLFLVTMLTLLGGFSMACNTNRPADRYWANDWDLPMDFSCHRG